MYKISDYPQIQNNFFLFGRNAGACKKLVGEVNLLTVFLRRSPSDWSDSCKNSYYLCARGAADLLMSEAKKYGARLNIKCFYLETSVPATASPREGFELIKDFFHKESMEELQAHYKKQMAIDEFPVILALNEAGRSFSFKKNEKNSYDTQEISAVFFRENEASVQRRFTIAHELLHQFGAIDFYFPREVEEIAEKYIGDSFMHRRGSITVDDLTAYLIGWKDTISENSYWFLKNTMWMNAKYYEESKKAVWSL